ncbi:MAG: S-layer homology domain-containing protein [Oscillospiraceae bacterium]|nr:S-layer homology domain-containing protein [Oscillospiraceae bacterium]
MRKSLIVLLVLAMLFSLLPAASAANLTELQRGLVETALAYYNKGTLVQYDSSAMTAQSRLEYGTSRINSGEAPELAASDHTIYSVCSDFCYDIYYDATGYELMGGPRKSVTANLGALKTDDPMCIYRWEKKVDGEDTDGKPLNKAYALLQPGDLIVGRTGNAGHAMFFAGDVFGNGTNYIIHCTGSKINRETGIDEVENTRKGEGGAIRADDAKSHLFTHGGKLCLTEKYISFVVLRPMKAADFSGHSLTAHAKARLRYPGIRVDKETSITKYQSPENEQALTVTISVRNYGSADYHGLTVTEQQPIGASVKEGSLAWTIDVPAGETRTVSYTAAVTAKRGETVTIPSGSVGGLDTRAITFRVGGKKLTAAAHNTLSELAKGNSTSRAKLRSVTETDVAFLKQFYNDLLGIELPLPDHFNSLLSEQFSRCIPLGRDSGYAYLWQLKDPSVLSGDAALLRAMAIAEHLGGYAVYLGDNPKVTPHTMNPVDRTTDYKESFYEPGDFFIGLADNHTTASTAKNVHTFVYLGNGKVLSASNGSTQITAFSNSLGLAFKYNVFLGFRPTLAYGDVTTEAKAITLPFTDVKSSDWFYTYVKDLYTDGTVSGMTATTFVPGGNLTYGQALKLIVCALGHGEQAKSGAHWASGYLTFAKDKGWLTGDVNLDGSISRLNFCKIAAKAKNLTAQPESNKFTDTSDPDVLALNHAGVVGGMSETTFAPDSTLTRAQISKIISLLRKL